VCVERGACHQLLGAEVGALFYLQHPIDPTSPTPHSTHPHPHLTTERVLAEISFSAPEKAAAAQPEQQQTGGSSSAGGKDESGKSAGSKGSSSSSSSSSSAATTATASADAVKVQYDVTAADVEAAVGQLLKTVDLSKYML